jgi:GTP pyrophosphokinase
MMMVKTRKEFLPDNKQLSERFDDALGLASDLHRSQPRKGTEIPYVSHLLAVASLVIEAGGDEDQAIAALLHDAIEDQGTRIDRDDIAKRFGDRVVRIVEACTDEIPGSIERTPENSLDRKERYLVHLKTAPEEALLVSCADKLHNARSIARDLEVRGKPVWDRFNVGREGTLRYYKGLVTVFRERGIAPGWLLDELEQAVNRMAAER